MRCALSSDQPFKTILRLIVFFLPDLYLECRVRFSLILRVAALDADPSAFFRRFRSLGVMRMRSFPFFPALSVTLPCPSTIWRAAAVRDFRSFAEILSVPVTTQSAEHV